MKTSKQRDVSNYGVTHPQKPVTYLFSGENNSFLISIRHCVCTLFCLNGMEYDNEVTGIQSCASFGFLLVLSLYSLTLTHERRMGSGWSGQKLVICFIIFPAEEDETMNEENLASANGDHYHFVIIYSRPVVQPTKR